MNTFQKEKQELRKRSLRGATRELETGVRNL